MFVEKVLVLYDRAIELLLGGYIMKWTQIPLGPLQTNCYVIENDEKDAIVFDPGGDGEAFVQWLNDQDLKPSSHSFNPCSL